MARIALFAYGSLVDPASATRTLGRELPAPVPARLQGWRRRWSVARDNLSAEKAFAIEPGGRLPRWILGLNIEPGTAPSDAPNGALLEVTEVELERLDLRELRYDRIEVTASFEATADFDLVVAYAAKADHFAPQPPPGAVIMAPYARVVEAAFAALGPDELETYLRSTGEPPVEAVEATLVRDEIPPGNPREW